MYGFSCYEGIIPCLVMWNHSFLVLTIRYSGVWQAHPSFSDLPKFLLADGRRSYYEVDAEGFYSRDNFSFFLPSLAWNNSGHYSSGINAKLIYFTLHLAAISSGHI